MPHATGVHRYTTRTRLQRIETPTSLRTLTHEWERGTRGQKKKGHQPDLAHTCACACVRLCRARTRARPVYNVYTRCACNLYSARLQFYLPRVFVANRAHTVYVEPRCWHVHATFPFQNRFWRRAPRRPAQSTTSTLLSGLSARAVRLLTGATLVFFFLSLLFFPLLSLFRYHLSVLYSSGHGRCVVKLSIFESFHFWILEFSRVQLRN